MIAEADLLRMFAIVTAWVVFVAAWRLMYEAEMRDFKRSGRLAMQRKARGAASEDDTDVEFYGDFSVVDRPRTAPISMSLRNYCTCVTCSYSRQRAVMLKN